MSQPWQDDASRKEEEWLIEGIIEAKNHNIRLEKNNLAASLIDIYPADHEASRTSKWPFFTRSCASTTSLKP
jgi:hypothetical protein